MPKRKEARSSTKTWESKMIEFIADENAITTVQYIP